jgi:hypothetical protein
MTPDVFHDYGKITGPCGDVHVNLDSSLEELRLLEEKKT